MRWRLKSPASRLFTQPFIQAQIKENIKAPRHWPLCGEFPAQMASNAENVSIWWRHHELLVCASLNWLIIGSGNGLSFKPILTCCHLCKMNQNTIIFRASLSWKIEKKSAVCLRVNLIKTHCCHQQCSSHCSEFAAEMGSECSWHWIQFIKTKWPQFLGQFLKW